VLAASPLTKDLVLMCGMQARAVAGERDQVLNLVRNIAATPVEDGIVYEASTASTEHRDNAESDCTCASTVCCGPQAPETVRWPSTVKAVR
jgi:hypothetical protein